MMAFYILVKMLWSFFYFIVKLLFVTFDTSRKLYYVLGFPTDPVHAVAVANGEFFHYHHHHQPGEPRDFASRSLSPDSQRIVDDPNVGFIRQFCGWHVEADSDQLRTLLDSGGKCHNFALILIYHLSYDKFLSYALLFLLRWECWILLTLFFVLFLVWVSTFTMEQGINSAQLLTIMDGLFGVLFGLMIFWDTLNISPDKNTNNLEMRKRQHWKFRLMDAVLFLCIEATLIYYVVGFEAIHEILLLTGICISSIGFCLFFRFVER
jgi:hypothetical protein